MDIKNEVQKLDEVTDLITNACSQLLESIKKLQEVDCDIYDYDHPLQGLKEAMWALCDVNSEIDNGCDKLKKERVQ